MKLTASLVLFKSNPSVFEPAIESFLASTVSGVLVVADNSPEPLVSKLFLHDRVRYIHTGRNLGFGKAHNLAFKMVEAASDYHLILNPDITFGGNVLTYLVDLLVEHSNIGAVMPQIRYPNGELQRLCKLLPTPVDLLLRRFLPVPAIVEARNRQYEMHGLSQKFRSVVPTVSGCFLLVRSEILRGLDGFDERYFMYLEDVDLVRRVGERSDVVYDPAVFVVHAYGKGSYRNAKLLSYHLKSAIKYFNKWGWIWDPVRRQKNSAALAYNRNEGGAPFGGEYSDSPIPSDD